MIVAQADSERWRMHHPLVYRWYPIYAHRQEATAACVVPSSIWMVEVHEIRSGDASAECDVPVVECGMLTQSWHIPVRDIDAAMTEQHGQLLPRFPFGQSSHHPASEEFFCKERTISMLAQTAHT